MAEILRHRGPSELKHRRIENWRLPIISDVILLLVCAGNSSTAGFPFLSTVNLGNTQSPTQSMTIVASTSRWGSCRPTATFYSF